MREKGEGTTISWKAGGEESAGGVGSGDLSSGDPGSGSGDPGSISGNPWSGSGDPGSSSGDPVSSSGDPGSSSGDLGSDSGDLGSKDLEEYCRSSPLRMELAEWSTCRFRMGSGRRLTRGIVADVWVFLVGEAFCGEKRAFWWCLRL